MKKRYLVSYGGPVDDDEFEIKTGVGAGAKMTPAQVAAAFGLSLARLRQRVRRMVKPSVTPVTVSRPVVRPREHRGTRRVVTRAGPKSDDPSEPPRNRGGRPRRVLHEGSGSLDLLIDIPLAERLRVLHSLIDDAATLNERVDLLCVALWPGLVRDGQL